jgi:copper chaperone CopZ
MSEKVTLTVKGMKCGGCEANVNGRLEALEGIHSNSASFKENQVCVEYDASKIDLDAIKNVITEAGFLVED